MLVHTLSPAPSLIYTFVCLLDCSLKHSFTHSLKHSFTRSPAHPFAHHTFTYKLNRSHVCIISNIHSSTQSFVCSHVQPHALMFNHTLTRAVTHSHFSWCTHIFTHSHSPTCSDFLTGELHLELFFTKFFTKHTLFIIRKSRFVRATSHRLGTDFSNDP